MKPAEERLAAGNVIEALESMMGVINPFLVGHQKRVASLAAALAAELRLAAEAVEGVRIAGLLNDIEEVGTPVQILSKPARLNAEEFGLIKAHPQTGYGILKRLGFREPVAEIVLQHHERLDGPGYPHGLKGEAILMQARLLGVAEVVEAMSSHQMYRTSLGVEAALDEIEKNGGRLYDPAVAAACVRLFREKGFAFS
jgi:HD-GYP domain-containing protein (c-di-GMP phosphodiesterase class II)